MRKVLCIALLLVGAALRLPAQVLSEGQSLLFLPEENRTRAQVGFRVREEDEAYHPEEGSALLQGEFRAWSRHSLDSTHRVQGRVSYERGMKRAVNWNTSSDWDLLSPYITLDTVGGNLQKEQYRFAARFASRPGRFLYMLGADYRALQEWRSVDPRPRNITADLSLSASAGLTLGRYALVLEGSYRKYHQSNSTKFLDPRGNNTVLFHYLGLGRYSTRFSGAKASTDVRFQGNGFGVEGLLEPQNGQGWIVGGSFRELRLMRCLPGYNETPMSGMAVRDAGAYAGYKWREAYLRADVDMRRKQGTENIVDQTSAFNVIGGLDLYQETSWKAALKGFVAWRRPSLCWTLQPSAAYFEERADGRYPGGGYAFRYLGASALGTAETGMGPWRFQAGLSLGARLCLDAQMDVSAQEMDPRFLAYFDSMQERRSASALRLGADLTASRLLSGGLSLYARPEIVYCQYFPTAHHRIDALLSIGIEF